MMSGSMRGPIVRLAILFAAAMAAPAQGTSQIKEHMPYPSGQGYFLFTNLEEIQYCDELPKSITRTNSDVELVPCVEANRKTVRREDQGEAPSLFDLKDFYALAFWISMVPATIALCCFTDKPGVARLGRVAAKLIERLSIAKGLQRSILTVALLAVTASPLLFAIVWTATRHSTLTVMIDNAQDSGAQIEIGEAMAFYVPPMSRAFVYVDHPQRGESIHVTSTRGYEERVVLPWVWNDEGKTWVYDVGGANQDYMTAVRYMRR
jgi:hypothetical protein